MRDKTVPIQKHGKHRTGFLVVLILLSILALLSAALLIADNRYVRFYVSGDQNMTIEYGTVFTDPGVTAVTVGRIFGEDPNPLPVEVSGSVDSTILGTQTILYTVRWFFSEYSMERSVTVADTTPPVIDLKYIEGYSPSWMSGYAEEGYSAYDLVDGDLTGKVLRTKLPDRVIYTVSDKAGNTCSVERILPNLTYQPPKITLLGEANVVMQAGLWYTDPGVLVSDDLGNDLRPYLVTEGEVVPWQSGDYQITYSITSELGETISASRNVHVIPADLPSPVTPDTKTIYLTFDDGPGPYTERLIDILDRYGVKATFFVTAQDSKYYDLIGRAFRSGHSIGVHTFSHDYSKIYSSEIAFFEDFFKMEEIIKQQTGSYATLFRFPGGSSNTVSNFNPGIMSRLARAMNDMGYQYFDWNVYSGDAGETSSTNQIAKNIKEGCAQSKISVVLQHDIKNYSISAVESVILWGLENGYSFKALQMDSPPTHHGLNN